MPLSVRMKNITMIGQDLLEEFSNVYSDSSLSVFNAAYRHTRWKLRTYSRKILFPTVNKFPALYQYYFKLRKILSPDKYTDADPLKIVWVDPKRIEKTCNDDFGRPLQRGAVKSGDWDQDTGQFMSRDVPAQIKSCFENNDDIEEKLCSKVNKLSADIVQNGFLTQRRLLEERGAVIKSKNNDPVPTILNEITVNIGRDGEFLWRTYGQHRLAIARMLNIQKVPVLVCVRHKKWQDIRNQTQHAKEYEKLIHDTSVDVDHPDLQDLLGESGNQSCEQR